MLLPYLLASITTFSQPHISGRVAEENKVAVRFVTEGKHKGKLFGVAPTGQKVSINGIIIYELENNKIVNHWMQADSVALMQQIGAMPVESDGH